MKRFLAYVLIAAFLTACGFPQPANAASSAQSIQFLLSQVRQVSGPLSGGKVYAYAAGTTTPKTIWLNRGKTTEAANPYTLDANGTAALFGDGLYRFVLKTASGATVYDRDNISIKEMSTSTRSALDFMTAAQIKDVLEGTGAIDVTSALQSAIDAVSTRANLSFYPEDYTSPYWSANPAESLEWPAGVYRVNGMLTFYGDHVRHVGYGAVLNLHNDGICLYFNNSTYGEFEGFQMQVFSDTSATKAIALRNARWNKFKDGLIIYQGNYNPATYTLTGATANEGIYAIAGGADFSRDVIYNNFEDYRISKMGWAVHFVNDPTGTQAQGAVLAQNHFPKLVSHSTNGIWFEGVKGIKFPELVMEGNTGGIPFKLQNSGVISTSHNDFDVQWFEWTAPTFDIRPEYYNRFSVLFDTFGTFSYTGRKLVDSPNTLYRPLAGGGSVSLKQGGRFIVDTSSVSAEAVEDDGSRALQINGDTRLGRFGGADTTYAFSGPSGQLTAVHASGQGGITLAGSGATSNAALTFSNNYAVALAERFRISLNGATNDLQFSFGATPGVAPSGAPLKWVMEAGGVLRPGADGVYPIGSTSNRLQSIFTNKVNVAPALTPASASAACTTGDQAWDASYIYQCVATNTWKRAAIATW